MPNSATIKGTPIEEALKGFDRPEELYFIQEDGKDEPSFYGYGEQCIANAKFYPTGQIFKL